MPTLPTGLVAGQTGVVSWLEALNQRYNSEVVTIPCVTGGGSGAANTALILNYIADAAVGARLMLPAGRIGIEPINVTKMVDVMGHGKWGTTLVCLGNSAVSPYWHWNLPASTRGCHLSHLGFDLTASPLGTGLRVGVNAEWSKTDHVNMEGGALSIDNQAMNARYEWVRVAEAGMFFKAIESGLEVTLEHFIMERLTAGTTTKGIYIDAPAAGTIKGAVYGHDVRLAKLAGTVNVGLHAVAANTNSHTVPLFFTGLVLDNINGPAVKLSGIWRSTFDRGWYNGAAGTTSSVEIDGGGELSFSDNHMFGGFGAAGCSFEFLAATSWFSSHGNHLRTGPIYKMPAAGQPTGFQLDDITYGGVLSNDLQKLYVAQQLRGEIHHIARPPENAGLATLVNGTVTVANTRVNATTTMPEYQRRALVGQPGHLFTAGVTSGVGFTISSAKADGTLETGDNSQISWTIKTFL